MKKISFMIFYILLKNIPGNIYINKLRGMVIGMYAQGTKKNLQIGRAVNIPSPSSLIIGDDVVINSEVYLISGDSTITIGDGCLLAPRCFIQTQNHNYENKSLSIEVHLIDFNEDIYDKRIKITLLQYLRLEQKFESLEALTTQLNLDKKITIEYVANIQI